MRRVRRIRIGVCAFALLLAGAMVRGQDATTRRIVGRVVDGVSGKPMPGVRVMDCKSGEILVGTKLPEGVTDSQGEFSLVDEGDSYVSVCASQPGYFRRDGDQVNVFRRSQMGANQRFDVRLWPVAAIEGTLRDPDGNPVVRWPVLLLKRSVRSGIPILTPNPGWPDTSRTFTDERGVFRFNDLVPGLFAIDARPPQLSLPLELQPGRVPADAVSQMEMLRTLLTIGQSMSTEGAGRGRRESGFEEILADGATAASRGTDGVFTRLMGSLPEAPTAGSSGLLSLGVGERRTNVDVRLARVPVFRVTGKVVPRPSEVASWVYLVAGGSVAEPLPSAVAVTALDRDGRFAFLNVPKGEFLIQVGSAQAAPPSVPYAYQTPRPESWGSERLTVDGNVDNAVINLRLGSVIRGTIRFDGQTSPPDRLVWIRFLRADGVTDVVPRAAFDPAGRFQSPALAPGVYLLTVMLPLRPPGSHVTSAMAGNRDISVTPIDMSLGDVNDVVVNVTLRTASIAGTARDSAGGPDSEAVVVLFPTSDTLWTHFGSEWQGRIRRVRANSDGRFEIGGLPSGSYFVAALREDDNPDDWPDPQFLRRVSAFARTLTVSEGEDVTTDLRRSELPGQ